jgi:hypothetical protein
MGFIQVRTLPTVPADMPFACDVFIIGASPGDTVIIRLAQTAGAFPLFGARSEVPIAADGSGVTRFDVVLRGAGTEARLLADDISSHVPLAAGDAHVSVTP